MLRCCSCLDNFSFTCWDHRDKVSFRVRSPRLSTLMKAFTRPPLLIIVLLIVFMCVCLPLQQWPMYMVDYSGVNVQVPGKVNYWRTTADRSKGIYSSKQNGGMRVNVTFMTLGFTTLTLCPGVWSCSLFCSRWQWSLSQECYDLKQSLRTPRTRKLMFQIPVWVLSVEEQQNVCGSKTLGGKQTNNTKAWLVFCILPPHSASRTALGSPSEADHYICLLLFFFFFFPNLNSGHRYLSIHWVESLDAAISCVAYRKKMSLVTIWFHDILIFVLFIYYIYWTITLCAGM